LPRIPSNAAEILVENSAPSSDVFIRKHDIVLKIIRCFGYYCCLKICSANLINSLKY
jgi:hypothetical protein